MNTLAFILGWMWGSSRAEAPTTSRFGEKFETFKIFAGMAFGMLLVLAFFIGAVWFGWSLLH